MYLNFVSFNLQTDLSEKAVSIQRYRSAATFMRLCGKNRVHGHAVELQFRAHKMLAIHVHVYVYKVHILYLRFGLINHIP